MNAKLSSIEYEPEHGGDVKSLVIMLHGYGADGEDLASLAPYFAETLPNTYFIFPNAPNRCGLNPFGGLEWFDLSSYDPKHMQKGVKSAAPLVEEYALEQLNRFKLPPENLVLSGFSQGAMLALHVGIRMKQKIGGILSFSGAILEPPSGNIRSKPEICLIHGEMDTVVPFAALANAAQLLKKEGLKVESHPIPYLAHGIDDAALEIGRNFLTHQLSDLP
jgi:phospholipase/carboxylesterase